MASRLSSLRGSLAGAGVRLADCFSKDLVDDIFNCAIKRQTGVTLRHMLDFGANPVERQLLLSAQFLHQELPVRLAHRVAELENLPYGLSAKPHVLKVCQPARHSSRGDGNRSTAATDLVTQVA